MASFHVKKGFSPAEGRGKTLPFGKDFPIGGLGKFPQHREGKLGIFGKLLLKIGKDFLANEEFSTSWGRVMSCLRQAFMSKRDFSLPSAGEKLFPRPGFSRTFPGYLST